MLCRIGWSVKWPDSVRGPLARPSNTPSAFQAEATIQRRKESWEHEYKTLESELNANVSTGPAWACQVTGEESGVVRSQAWIWPLCVPAINQRSSGLKVSECTR